MLKLNFLKNNKIYLYVTSLKLANKLISFLSFIFLVNKLNPNNLGEFVFCLSIISILSIFSLPGINISLIKFFDKKNNFFLKASLLSLKFSFIASLILLIISIYYYLSSNTVLSISFLLASFFFPLLKGLLSWKGKKIAENHQKKLIELEFFNTILLNTLMVSSLLVYNKTQNLILLIYLIIPSLQNLLLFNIERKKINRDINEEFIKEINIGKKYSKYQLMPLITKEIDKISVFYILSSYELAILAVIQKFPEFIKNLTNEIIFYFFNKLSKLESYSKEIRNIQIKLSLIFFFICAFFTFFIYPFIYNFFFKNEYLEYLILSQILIITVAVSYDEIFKVNFINSQLKNKSILQLNMYNSFFKFLISPIMVFLFGLWGAVYSIITQRIFNRILISFIIKKYHIKEIKLKKMKKI